MRTNHTNTRARLLAAFLSGLIPFALTACEDPETDVMEEATTEVDEVTDEPMQFAGQQIRLVGEVDDIASPSAFELEGNDWIFDDGILVVSAQPMRFGATALTEDDQVVVEGTVRTFVATEVERELGWDLDPELEVEWDARPVLVASSVSRVGQAGYWSADEAPEGRLVGMATVYEAPDRAALAGTQIAITSVPVRSVTPNGLWIGYDDASSTFVVPPEGTSLDQFGPDSEVTLTGTFQTAPAADEAMQRWNLDGEAAQQLANDTVYVQATVLRLAEQREPPQQEAPTAALTIDAISAEPTAHVGQRIQDGEAVVTRVISDRAFYLDAPNGEDDVLAIVREDVPEHEMIDIDAGQRLRFDADILAAADPLAGTLEADAQQAIRERPAFLSMHWRDVEILGATEG